MPSRTPSEARAALGDPASVGLGFVPLGVASGVLVVHAGVDWWWASLSSALIYGGSFEFPLIGMATAALPLASVAVSAFLVNVRHVFSALSFPLHRVEGPPGKAYGTFALCDEACALTAGEQARSWSGRRIRWLRLLLHLYWAGGSTAGALLGSLIPEGVTGLDFALTALFAVLALDAVRDRRGDLPTLPLALLSALTARLLFPGGLLPAAFALFTAGLLIRRLATRESPGHA
ncbi:AzlC family ABC transporter permease [Streptomyces alanosinicus]|uniref:Integral membrane amino acid transport protein n=1 Tax=Streptomyces alanosinicus TaxID=68171 RepID=A0A918YLW2_9ACTN|nr:AzlC family ABC transporter permease [Streptomyces alanosinicus]GHE08205.1 putative integral membrane amino acid transport protein [Streptomyces alanosinicus]